MSGARNHADDLRAAIKLAIAATKGVTDVVEEVHQTIASGPAVLGRPLAAPVRLVTGIAYGAVRGVTHLVGLGLDRTLAEIAPLLGESTPGPEREAVLSALNGVLGDHLAATGSPLAIPMTFRSGGRALELGALAATGKLLVLVHGSSMNDRQWLANGHDHGAALAELGYTPVYLHYNTGLHISTNGRYFADLLEDLVASWPVPVEEIAIVGHSMGGLVARSAVHVAGDRAWRKKLRKLVFLGTPHHGSPLERGGSWLETILALTSYSAPIGRLGRIRSAGVTDLRYGNVLDEHWTDKDRFAKDSDPRRDLLLPADVAAYAIAATTAKELADVMPGDGLVPVASALGRHERADLTLGFLPDRQWVAVGMGHIDLLRRPEVYEKLRAWLAE